MFKMMCSFAIKMLITYKYTGYLSIDVLFLFVCFVFFLEG